MPRPLPDNVIPFPTLRPDHWSNSLSDEANRDLDNLDALREAALREQEAWERGRVPCLPSPTDSGQFTSPSGWNSLKG